MTENDYKQITEWMSDMGFFATHLPAECYNCDVSP